MKVMGGHDDGSVNVDLMSSIATAAFADERAER